MHELLIRFFSALDAMKNHLRNYLFPYTFLLFCIYRVLRLERKFSNKIDDDWFFMKQGVLEDGKILGYCLLLYIITLSIKNRSFEVIGKILIAICFFIYCLDVVLFKMLGMRLMLSDVVKFARDIEDVASIISEIAISADGILVTVFSAVLVAICYTFINKSEGMSGNTRGILLSISLIIILFTSGTQNAQYCHAWLYKNVFAINNSATVNNGYSESFSETIFEQSYKNEISEQVETGKNRRPNIIIVAIESLSSYQSNYFSGLNDMTPKLDMIAGASKSFTNFYANGFTTEGGLISILTGVTPIPCPASFSNEMKGLFSFEGFFNPKKSIPSLLNENGYHTEFITTGKTSYSNKKDWLYNIGFETVTGDDNPDYLGWPRHKFNAAPDEALYRHVMNRITSYSNDKPFFYFVETVSTHFPFINPETNQQTESAAFSYGDKQIGIFFEKLKNNNFFENGILIITGDHRTMTPLKENEIKLYGNSASARVPLIIVDGLTNTPTIIAEPFQHTDLLSSFECLVERECTLSKYSGNVFASNPTRAKEIVAVNGSDRNIVNLYSGDSFSQIILDGDNTRVVSGNTSQDIVAKINYERLFHLKYGMNNAR